MAKNTIILSVSIRKEQAEWLDEVGLSTSSLLQSAIDEKMEIWQTYNNDKQKLIQNMQHLQKMLEEKGDYLSEKGLFDDYVAWRSQKHGAI